MVGWAAAAIALALLGQLYENDGGEANDEGCLLCEQGNPLAERADYTVRTGESLRLALVDKANVCVLCCSLLFVSQAEQWLNRSPKTR